MYASAYNAIIFAKFALNFCWMTHLERNEVLGDFRVVINITITLVLFRIGMQGFSVKVLVFAALCECNRSETDSIAVQPCHMNAIVSELVMTINSLNDEEIK